MRELRASEQGQKGHGKRRETGKEVLQGAFPTDGIAKEQHKEIDDLILPKASSHQTHLVREGFQCPMMGEILRYEDNFGKPRGDGWPFLGRGLENNTCGVCDHQSDLLTGTSS